MGFRPNIGLESLLSAYFAKSEMSSFLTIWILCGFINFPLIIFLGLTGDLDSPFPSVLALGFLLLDYANFCANMSIRGDLALFAA